MRRCRLRTVLAAGLVAAVASIVGVLGDSPRRVHACSCLATNPTPADVVGAADIAFVGTVVANQPLATPVEADLSGDDVRYQLVVEVAVKGVEIGDEVTLFGNTAETSCGTATLDLTTARHAIVANEYGGRFRVQSSHFDVCSQTPTVDELVALDRTLPPTSRGPTSLIVVGRLGEAEVISFDAYGMPVAFGDLAADTGGVTLCPGGERFVVAERTARDGAWLSIRSTATLDELDRLGLEESAALSSQFAHLESLQLSCAAPDGLDVAVLLPWENRAIGSRTLVGRVRPSSLGGVETAEFERLDRATFDRASGAVVGVSDVDLVRVLPSVRRIETVAPDVVSGPTTTGAVFLLAGDGGVWWVGLGDGALDYQTHLVEIVRVAAGGEVTGRWPLGAAGADLFSPPQTFGGYWLSSDVRIAIPNDLATGEAIVPEPSPFWQDIVPLGNGSAVTSTWRTDTEPIAVSDGSTAVPLHGLVSLSAAIAVPDGSTVEPESVERTATEARFDSEWIVPRDGGSEQVDETMPSHETNPGDEPTASDAEPNSADPRAGDAGSSPWWLIGLGAVAVGVIALAVAVVITGRRRARTG